jgi:hypothetical protein
VSISATVRRSDSAVAWTYYQQSATISVGAYANNVNIAYVLQPSGSANTFTISFSRLDVETTFDTVRPFDSPRSR